MTAETARAAAWDRLTVALLDASDTEVAAFMEVSS